MKCPAAIWISVLAGCWLHAASAQEHVDNMTLNGMSTYSELLQPYYIAALSLASRSNDAATILGSESRRRFEMRVITKEYTPRRFSVQWTQALLINTPRKTLNNFDDAFVQWLNVAQHGFMRGDRIVVDGYPDGHSEVRVDGIEIFRVDQPGFMNMLLGTWIGKRPPSSGFRHDLLNSSYDASVVAEYDSLEPTRRRIASVRSWVSRTTKPAVDPAAVGVAKNDHDVERKSPADFASDESRLPPHSGVVAAVISTESVAATSAPMTKAVTFVPTAVASVDKVPQTKLAASVAKVTEHKVAPVSATAKEVSGTTDNPQRAKSGTPAAGLPIQVAMVVKPAAELSPVHDDAYRAQQELMLKLYRRAIIKRTLKKVEYPRRAVRLNQEGEVTLDITVARSGHILSVEPTKSSRYSLLNKAAVEAVSAVDDYPVVPAALDGGTVTVTVPVRFRLQ